MSNESRKNLSIAKTGVKRKPFSDEWKQNISLSSIGPKNSFYGKKHSKETLRKQSEIKNQNSPKMTSKDYRIANKFLRIRATQSGSCKPFSVIDNLPAVQAEKICSYLRKKHGVLMC